LCAVNGGRARQEMFQARTRTLMLPKGLERFEAYRGGGVRDWVHNTLRRMTDNRAASRLTGIGRTYTYTPGDGSGELNMGQDIDNWKKVARKEEKESKNRTHEQAAKAKKASDNRKQKRDWLTAIRERLVAELKAVIKETQDDGFKSKCQALLARIPKPYWETKNEKPAS